MSLNAENATGSLDLSEFEKQLLSLSEKNINCDCEFIVGYEQIITVKGHKLLFSAASEVFQAMFYGELKEENAVRIQDLDPEGFQGMKFFIYTGKVNFLSALNALYTFNAARKYLISRLSKKCIEYIVHALLPSEALQFYEYCKVHQISEFEKLCCKIIQENTFEVVNSNFFSLAKMETIEFVLAFPTLNLTSEAEVIEYFKKWVDAEVNRDRLILEDMTTHFNSLKRHIRFLTLSSKYFVSKLADLSILTEKEKLAIACNLLQPGSQPMPETLSSVHEYRKFTNFIESTPSFSRQPPIQQHMCSFSVPIDNNCSNLINYLYTLPSVIASWITFKITYHRILKDFYCFLIEPLAKEDNLNGIWLFEIRSKLRIVAKEKEDDLFLVSESHLIVDWGLKKQNFVVIARIPKHKLENQCFLKDNQNKVTIVGYFSIVVVST